MWPHWSVFYDGHWKRVTARHLWSAFSFWCLCCVMRWFLIIANFMALQAVLILLGVPLPILSSRRVFEQLSAPDLTATLCLFQSFCAVISVFFLLIFFDSLTLFITGHETTAPVTPCMVLFVPVANSGPRVFYYVLFCLQWFLILVLTTLTILHVYVV